MKNKIGATTACYAGFSLDSALRGIAKAGIKYVEPSAMYEVCDAHSELTEHVIPEKMTKQDLESLKYKFEDYGLQPMSISGHANLIMKESVEALKRRIDLAKEIGAEIVNTKVGDPSSEEEVNLFYNNIAQIAYFASQNNVIIGLETSGSYFSTAQKAAPILKKINSPFIRLNYDTANVIYYAGTRPEEDIEYGIEFIAHIHLKDKIGGKGEYNFPYLGEGNIDFKKIFTILERNRFEGPLSIEVEFDGKRKETLDDVDYAVKKSFEFLKNILNI
jgi:sugar phosphate isomerase/epimerase